MPKSLYLVSLGCPKNLVDAEVMAGAFAAAGYDVVARPDDAEVILVNTCAFILPAREESIHEILAMSQYKTHGRCRFLVVAGCLAQRYGDELARELPEVNLFAGLADIPGIAAKLERLAAGETVPRCAIAKPSFLMTAAMQRLLPPGLATAYLKIADGCSNRCTYCAIPDIRGDARSRRPDDILAEAERLVSQGVREIILTAQDTTAYGQDLKGRPTLAALLKDLTAVPELRWIRLLYTYPARLDKTLFTAMAASDKICAYLDMPVQHADDTVLAAMNRRGDRADILRAIREVRETIPGVALRTSLIVGFPGETPARFGRLLDFVREARFDHLGVFTYSREEGTPAAALPSRISQREKQRRRDAIMEEQAVISSEITATLVGSVQEILVEAPADLPGFDWVGRARRQAPDIDGVTYIKGKGLRIGQFVSCRITGASDYDLTARPLRVRETVR